MTEARFREIVAAARGSQDAGSRNLPLVFYHVFNNVQIKLLNFSRKIEFSPDLGFVTLDLHSPPSYSEQNKANLQPDSHKPRVANPKSDFLECKGRRKEGKEPRIAFSGNCKERERSTGWSE